MSKTITGKAIVTIGMALTIIFSGFLTTSKAQASPITQHANLEIQKILVKPGSYVFKGQPVAKVKDVTLPQLNLELTSARTRLWLAEKGLRDEDSNFLQEQIEKLETQKIEYVKNYKPVSRLLATNSGTVDEFLVDKGEIIKPEQLLYGVKVSNNVLYSRFNPLKISSGFGSRIHPVTGAVAFHNGIDLPLNYGTPVYAYDSGFINAINEDIYNAAGKYVFISHGSITESRYLHLESIAVKPNQYVRKGEVIGYVGSTGRSTGPHLHFEIRDNGTPVNPLVEKDAAWYVLAYDL
jgi:murein DD-endopeptidase MepM/ murein hydrolase activator NlpD